MRSAPGAPDLGLRSVVAGLGLCPVVPLLAWVYGLGPFAAWFWLAVVPALALLAAIAWAVSRPGSGHPRLRAALVAGTIGGLVGTAGYDLFRVPFAALGLRLLDPIDSYGVLLLGAESSSPLSGFAGWAYHLSNGVGFGIAYAAVALGRRWWWGLTWAMVLETATIATPFADAYALRGQWPLIAIAYAAHVPYGLAVGGAAARGEALVAQLVELSRRTTVYALGAVLGALLLWHQPFAASGAGATAAVVDGRFSPQWLRVPVGGCAVIRRPDGPAERRCFAKGGIHRVRLDGRPYSGGFVIVDPAMER